MFDIYITVVAKIIRTLGIFKVSVELAIKIPIKQIKYLQSHHYAL